MKRWMKYIAGALWLAGLAPQVHAQAVPAVGAAPVGAAAVAPVAAPAAAPQANLFSFICLTPEQKLACKEKFCNCALGQMLNNGLGAANTLSGGFICTICPTIRPADLLKPADSAEGAAARVKLDEANAKARREAVRYLGTVDCNYWPEAQEALVNALRGDRNECVRLEAAFALNRGCCCTKMTIKGLVNCVSLTDEDGFPRENSERVLFAAHAALVHCINCYTEVVPVPALEKGKEPVPPPKPETVPTKGEAKPDKLGRLTPAEYYHRVESESRQQLIAEGQRAVTASKTVSRQGTSSVEQSSPSGLVDIFAHAFGGGNSMASTESVVIQQQGPKDANYRKITAAPTVVQVGPTKTVTYETTGPVSAPMTPVKPVPVMEKPVSFTPGAPSPTPVTVKPMTTTQTTPARSSPATSSVQVTQTTAKSPTPSSTSAGSTTAGPNMTMAQVVSVLRESPHPEYREWAADNLATVDGWTHPTVVAALAQAAQKDKEPVVRAASVRALGRMRCGTMTVFSAVQGAMSDTDASVRKEAELAMRNIGKTEPVGAKVPAGH